MNVLCYTVFISSTVEDFCFWTKGMRDATRRTIPGPLSPCESAKKWGNG
jgi:hypothetical protein